MKYVCIGKPRGFNKGLHYSTSSNPCGLALFYAFPKFTQFVWQMAIEIKDMHVSRMNILNIAIPSEKWRERNM